MKKVVFPFDEAILGTLNNLTEYVGDFELASPCGWGLVGRNYEINEKKYVVKDIFCFDTEESVELWLVNSKLKISIESILLAISQIKVETVFCLRHLILDDMNKLKQKIGEENIKAPSKSFVNSEEERLWNINIPIVLVASITEEAGKFDVQEELYLEFRQKGYSTGLVSTRSEAILLGAKTIPEFLYDNQISMKEKIIRFNYFIKEYSQSQKLELIIIGIPGEVAILNNYVIGHAGEMAYIISQSVNADMLILCSMCNEFFLKNRVDIGKKIEERFGCKVNLYLYTNRILDLQETEEKKEIIYVTLDPEYAKNSIMAYNDDKVYCSFLKQELKRVVENIIETLS